MQNNLELLRRAAARWKDKNEPAGEPLSAQELQQVYDLTLRTEGCDVDELETAINHFIDYTPNSAHQEFYKLLYSGANQEALLGDWVTSLCNATMHTYQVGPVATLMELELIRQWNDLIGFADGDGVMVSGGSQANLIGMLLARHRALPDLKRQGFFGSQDQRPLIAYVSDQAHYSYQRAANLLGIGSECLRSVISNAAGQIDPQALGAAIESDLLANNRPFFIGLTAGSTVTGAFDDVGACAEVARDHDIWVHIDGAWGAPSLFSAQHKQLLVHSELADSFAWDAHKLMNVPITAAVILVKQAGQLQQACGGGGGEYLFHQDANAAYNLGERSIQCGRRVDALKVWLSWKARGHNGFAEKIDHLQNLKTHCVALVEAQAELEMLAPAPWLNVLFRYQPQRELAEDKLAELNQQICQLLKTDGGPYVDYARYKGRLGIRLIIANELTTEADVEFLFNECLRIGREINAGQE